MKAMGVVLTQPLSFPRNFRAILALPRTSSLLVCVEGGQGWDWCQFGGGYLDSEGLLSVPGGSCSSHPYACITGPPKRRICGWVGKGQIEIIGFVFDFVFFCFLRIKVLLYH